MSNSEIAGRVAAEASFPPPQAGRRENATWRAISPAASLIVFFVLEASPGDPAQLILRVNAQEVTLSAPAARF